MEKIRDKIDNIVNSFDGWYFDMETTIWDWVIYFWKLDSDITFFFELPNGEETWEKERNRLSEIVPKVKISINNKWETIENKDINILITKTKEIINGKKEK